MNIFYKFSPVIPSNIPTLYYIINKLVVNIINTDPIEIPIQTPLTSNCFQLIK